MLYQQGDVLFKSVDAIPIKAKPIRRKKGKPIIVAYGETTGHAHKILDDVKAFLDEGENMYVEGPFTVVHEEHNPVSVPEGIYKVQRVMVYDHFLEESRRAVD